MVSHDAAPKAERKRRFEPKVRTGCNTCKIRRVKCDEEKPHCRRCVSTGRACDGYDVIRIAQTKTNALGVWSLSFKRPASRSPDTSTSEQAAFETYRIRLARRLPGTWGPMTWSNDILTVATSQPYLQHMVIALGYFEQGRLDTNGQADTKALKHYSKAMKILHDKIDSGCRLPPDVVLMACLLFFTFEIQQSGWDQSHAHLNGGICLIYETLQGSASAVPPASQTTMDSLITAFRRLDTQMCFFRSERISLVYSDPATDPLQGPSRMRFSNVWDAWESLNAMMAAMRELNYAAEVKITSDSLTAEDRETYSEIQALNLADLTDWERAFDALTPKLRNPEEINVAHLLRTHAYVARLMITMALSNGREMLWDNHIPVFERIVRLASGVCEYRD